MRDHPFSRYWHPAFPCSPESETDSLDTGMTMREWWAGLSLQGLLANGPLLTQIYAQSGSPAEACLELGKLAFLQADTMLRLTRQAPTRESLKTGETP